MTTPNDPSTVQHRPASDQVRSTGSPFEPGGAEPRDTVAGYPAVTKPATSPDTRAPGPGAGSTVRAKLNQVLAGAAELAEKVREDAPRKMQELREKRAGGRCIILREVAGRTIAVGPYPDEEAARTETNLQDPAGLPGAPRVVELLTPAAYAETTSRAVRPTQGSDTARSY